MSGDPAYAAAADCTGATDQYAGIFGFHAPSVLDLVLHEWETQVFVEDIPLRQANGTFQIERGLDLNARVAVSTRRNAGLYRIFEVLVQRRKCLPHQDPAGVPVIGSEQTCRGMQCEHRQGVIAPELEFLAQDRWVCQRVAVHFQRQGAGEFSLSGIFEGPLQFRHRLIDMQGSAEAQGGGETRLEPW